MYAVCSKTLASPFFSPLWGLCTEEALYLLNSEEYEKNIIEIFDFLLTDLSESISLKELNSSYPDAANYLFTRYGLDESCNLSVKDLKRHINSYTRSKEFVDVLKEKVNFIICPAVFRV